MDTDETIEEHKNLAEGTFLAKWPKWIRWLLFLPTAIFVPVLFFLFQKIMQTWFLDIGPDAFYFVLMRGITYGGGFVFIGSYVAPNYQRAVSVVLLIFLSMVVAIGILAAIMYKSPIADIIEALLMLASGGYATYFIFNEYK